MSNFESASTNISALETKLLGPRYSYTDHIKSPDEMGMSGDGNREANIVFKHVKLLLPGGGNASTVGRPLGKQFFLKMVQNVKIKNQENKLLDHYILIIFQLKIHLLIKVYIIIW